MKGPAFCLARAVCRATSSSVSEREKSRAPKFPRSLLICPLRRPELPCEARALCPLSCLVGGSITPCCIARVSALATGEGCTIHATFSEPQTLSLLHLQFLGSLYTHSDSLVPWLYMNLAIHIYNVELIWEHRPGDPSSTYIFDFSGVSARDEREAEAPCYFHPSPALHMNGQEENSEQQSCPLNSNLAHALSSPW